LFIVIFVCVVGLPLLALVWYADQLHGTGFSGNARQSSVAVPARPVPDGSGGRAIAWGKRSGPTAPELSLMLRATDADQWWNSLPAAGVTRAERPDTNPSSVALQLAWPSAGGAGAKTAQCSAEGAASSGCQPFITRMVLHRDSPAEHILTAFSTQKLQDDRPMPGFWTQSRGNSPGPQVPEFAGFACPRSPSGFWRRRVVNVPEAEAKLAAQLHCFGPESWLHRAAPFLFGYERHVFAPTCDSTGKACQVTFLYRGRLVKVDPPPDAGDTPLRRFHVLAAAWSQLARMEREAANPATAQDLLVEARLQFQSCQAAKAETRRATCLRAAELATRAAAASPREATQLIAAATDGLWQVERDVDRVQQRYYDVLLTTGHVSDAAAMRALARRLQSVAPASPGTQDDPSGNARREQLIAKAKPLALNPPADAGQAAHELRRALLRHLPESTSSADRIAILRALLDETLAQAAANPQGNPNDVVDAWTSYISALWRSERWSELHAAARSLQAAWLGTPEPVGVAPHSDGAREYFVSSQLVSVYLRSVRAGAGEADTVHLAEAATARAERVFGAGSSAAAEVRQMQQQLSRDARHKTPFR
jgi:hypothetical protein